LWFSALEASGPWPTGEGVFGGVSGPGNGEEESGGLGGGGGKPPIPFWLLGPNCGAEGCCGSGGSRFKEDLWLPKARLVPMKFPAEIYFPPRNKFLTIRNYAEFLHHNYSCHQTLNNPHKQKCAWKKHILPPPRHLYISWSSEWQSNYRPHSCADAVTQQPA